MEMRKKTVSMTMIDGKLVDNYERNKRINDLMYDAIMIHTLPITKHYIKWVDVEFLNEMLCRKNKNKIC
jgi:hypothetical protein